MNAIINAAFSRGRTVALCFVMIILMGGSAYFNIPKESEPDIPIPIIYVSAFHEGIAPEDAERLLARPLEKELQSIEGIKEMRSVAGEGYASVTLEFDAGFDSDQAIQDVRDKVDLAKSELPPESDEPRVTEINVALFPVITVVLSGNLPERMLVTAAREIKDNVEALPGVLSVDIGGDREEVLEVIANSSVMETYDISFTDLFTLLQRNNRLVAAGALDTGAGRMILKVPGVIEEIEDVLNLPIKVVDNTVVRFKDVASVRRTFKDPNGFARVAGEPAVVLEISKRTGANIIETIEQVRSLIGDNQAHWPQGMAVNYMQDKSEQIRVMLGDLQNNVLTAIALVMIVIIAALGLRPAILVGLAIPGSFLTGILVLDGMGLTLNIVVLFSLILVVGMLVDGAIVTIELADRKIAEGLNPVHAYAEGAKRMAWPIISSTATTLAVFLPLLFWPGVVGEFMKFLPITVLITLMASLVMALIFIPVLGGMMGKRQGESVTNLAVIAAAEEGSLEDIKGFAGHYLRTLSKLVQKPGRTFGVAVVLLLATYIAFAALGRGVEFFPSVEPNFAQIQVQARGDLSITERDALVQKVEERFLDMKELKTVYARTLGSTSNSGDMPEDVIGVIQMEFIYWEDRRPAEAIIAEIRNRTSDIPGIMIQAREQESGPSGGKPIQINISGRSTTKISQTVDAVRKAMNDVGGFVDVEDSRPLPGIEWRILVDREKAARYGADITLLGDAIKMITGGIQLAEYRPDDADEELDIRLRFPVEERNLEKLRQLKVPTSKGQIPISNFIKIEPAQKTGTLRRTDGHRVMTVRADVETGVLADNQVRKVKDALADFTPDPSVRISFKGQDADQREAGAFLANAFITAIFLMTVILITQFNSFYQAGLVLSAIIFSTAGVLLGLLVTGQPFGVVMGGIGVIALAGIVVNNNIVLIDTYNDLRKRGLNATDAVMRTAAQRVRPVLLTSITTVLGLLPMVLAINIDLIGQDISFGAPSTQWWRQLSSAIAGGLTFATVLTLILTPCLLVLGDNLSKWHPKDTEQSN